MKELQLPYRPRPYQDEFERKMFSGYRRAFLLYHRRAGKDIACWNFLINCAITDQAGSYFYILPTFSQGRRVVWDGINEDGKKFLDFVPDMWIDKINNSEMKLILKNGSLIQIVGSDQYNSLRGTNPKGVVFSEYAMQDPRGWTEVISPILVKNGGWAVFNTTPLGKNHAYDLWMMADRSEDWYTQKLTISDTRLISRQQIDREIAEGKTPEVIEQEYYCSFARGVDGCFYGRLISQLWDKGQVTSVPYDNTLPVTTAWDLGIADMTTIFFIQMTPGGEIHVIDYYENCGEALSHYVDVINKRNYVYDHHFFPHDVKARELGTGASREEHLRKLNLRPNMVSRLTVQDGIQCARSILPRCWFDKVKCKDAIKHLENYRKHYSDKLRCFIDRPLHDEHSHCADAFRIAALAIVKGKKSVIKEDEAEALYNEFNPLN